MNIIYIVYKEWRYEMMRWFIILTLCVVTLEAITPDEIVGKWYAYRQSTERGTVTVEKEYLHLHANQTFTIQLFVSVQKDDAFIKDLRIEGSGIWKSREKVLVMYIQKVEVPFAKEIYRISQESLRMVANTFKNKYENEPLRIIFIENHTDKKLVTTNQELLETSYIRQ